LIGNIGNFYFIILKCYFSFFIFHLRMWQKKPQCAAEERKVNFPALDICARNLNHAEDHHRRAKANLSDIFDEFLVGA
jgi:hypothetical protein